MLLAAWDEHAKFHITITNSLLHRLEITCRSSAKDHRLPSNLSHCEASVNSSSVSTEGSFSAYSRLGWKYSVASVRRNNLYSGQFPCKRHCLQWSRIMHVHMMGLLKHLGSSVALTHRASDSCSSSLLQSETNSVKLASRLASRLTSEYSLVATWTVMPLL